MFDLVTLFFVGNVVASALLGFKFLSRSDRTFKLFGVGLLLNAAAFLMWTTVVLEMVRAPLYAPVGTVLFVLALVVFFAVYIKSTSLTKSGRYISIAVFVGAAAVFFYLRMFIYPSEPSLSEEGLLLFNLHPMIKVLYIMLVVLAIAPTVEVVAAKFRGLYEAVVRYGFLAQIAGGIALITITDADALFVAGWIMGVIYPILWITLLFSKRAWMQAA